MSKEAIEFFIKRKTQLELELNSINAALNLLQENAKTDFSKFQITEIISLRKIPADYSVDLKYPAQVMWLLKNFGSQTVEEMVDNVGLIYGTENEQKLFKGLTHAASLMYNKEEINAEKCGKANKYSLKKKGDLSESP